MKIMNTKVFDSDTRDGRKNPINNIYYDTDKNNNVCVKFNF